MALISTSIGQVYKGRWVGVYPKETFKIEPRFEKPLKKTDTLCLIVGPDQAEYIPLIEKDTRWKVVYRAPMAVNRNYRYSRPRNTLFILESPDEPAV